MSKGKYIQKILYVQYKRGIREFKIKKEFNIRKSSFLKIFSSCIFHIHNGRYYVFNDPVIFNLSIKKYNFYNFKLGQFSYNKQLQLKHIKNPYMHLLIADQKKKKGMYSKSKKKKKLFFNKVK